MNNNNWQQSPSTTIVYIVINYDDYPFSIALSIFRYIFFWSIYTTPQQHRLESNVQL